MFTDIQSGDYSLMPESPAFELGIHEIILGNFGVQESLRYASSLQWLNEQMIKRDIKTIISCTNQIFCKWNESKHTACTDF